MVGDFSTFKAGRINFFLIQNNLGGCGNNFYSKLISHVVLESQLIPRQLSFAEVKASVARGLYAEAAFAGCFGEQHVYSVRLSKSGAYKMHVFSGAFKYPLPPLDVRCEPGESSGYSLMMTAQRPQMRPCTVLRGLLSLQGLSTLNRICSCKQQTRSAIPPPSVATTSLSRQSLFRKGWTQSRASCRLWLMREVSQALGINRSTLSFQFPPFQQVSSHASTVFTGSTYLLSCQPYTELPSLSTAV